MGAAVNGPARCPVCANFKAPGLNRCGYCQHRFSTKGCKLLSRDDQMAATDQTLGRPACKCSKPLT